MRNLGFLLLGTFLFACAGSSGEASDDTSSAFSAPEANKITTGKWGDMKIVATGGKVSGTYSAKVGDPSLPRQTCTITFAGDITSENGVEHAKNIATEGLDAATGELVATSKNGKPAVRLQADSALLANCGQSDLKEGVVAGRTDRLDASVAGYRIVRAGKAYFYDRVGGTPRAAYVVLGNVVSLLGADADGFVKARFEGGAAPTNGLLRTSDLAAADGSDFEATPRLSEYVLDDSTVSKSFYISQTDSVGIKFKLTVGGKDISANDYPIFSRAAFDGTRVLYTGAGCTISFQFADFGGRADVTQNGSCTDLDASVNFTGRYTSKY